MKRRPCFWPCIATMLAFGCHAGARAPAAAPADAASGAIVAREAASYSYLEHPGAWLPARTFRDSDDRSIHLEQLSARAPLILVLAYFHCSSLCGLVRSSLFNALLAAKLEAGRDYTLAVLSIDPHETSEQARRAKAADLAAFGSAGAAPYIHYLTGSGAAIDSVAAAVGFRNRFDPATRQFIHPAGVIFLSREGRVSGYLLGVGYTPAAVRSALERAGAGRIAAAAAPLLLICFHFDPSTGRYSLEILKLLRLAGILAVLTLGGMLVLLHRRERGSP